ncbi:hypothetical protein EV368DRAFT_62873 [Lentinula lateritia]|nr:hypothetical protein EV368DRAFT_62873 [Lentinula lateritia]
MSSANFTLTAELSPHLDTPLPISHPRTSYTRSPNPFGAIARPGGTKPEAPADLNSHPRSLVIVREQFDSSVISDICCPESLFTTDDDDYYSSIPHYISSIWHYLTPDDHPESKNQRVHTPASTLDRQYVYNSHPPVTSAIKARVHTDAYAVNPYPPPSYSSNYVAPTCLCGHCRGFPLPNSFSVSPSETPLPSPLPTTPADESYAYSFDVIA